MKETILITGGTGLIGKALTALFISKGYHISILSRKNRKNSKNISYYKWNLEKRKIDKNCLLNTNYIIHLAGERVATKRWSSKRKQQILNSRVASTNLLYGLLSSKKNKVKAFISASAIGYYGTVTSDQVFNEESAPGIDFLARVCKDWENAVNQIKSLNIRTVIFRTGIVLGKEKSALQKITPLFRMGLGTSIGDGKQYIPWIHLDDLCNIFNTALVNTNLKGPYNAVVGDNLTNQELSKAIAKQLKKPFFMPKTPRFILNLLYGEMSVILTDGSRVSAKKIKNEGVEFTYNTIEKALKNLL